MILTNRNLLVVVAATAFVAITAGFGIAGSQSGATQTAAEPATVETFVYFPGQYVLNAPNEVNDHIQAF
jgi:hypothetical protein